ncbi:MAG: hypothetical protein Q9202_004586 [Teloschistes flavicans]
MEDPRTEGTDADVFSQPVGSNGFIPRFPAPPKYIKVRSHGKKEKDFNRVFLAQQLRGRTGVEIAQAGGRHVKVESYKSGDPKKDGNAVWAMEFSKDGKYLAAGGQDYLVRVWTVISNADERRTHEIEEDAAGKEGEHVRLNAPVFRSKPLQEYEGHTASVLDLSWSKFHPRDDRFFLAGSLDSKLRLWSIPDKSVAYWNQLPDLITAVAFAPDGKTAIAGCLNGLCLFYETEGLKYATQIHVKSAHGKNAKGSKITGIQAIHFPPEDPNGEVKILITSNDSRIRVYNLRDKGLEIKLKGNQNSCSQIRASFSEDAKYIICGSEDRKAYIWPTVSLDVEKEKRPVEMFEAHSAIITTALMAPVRTRQLLSASGDPLYDLCNPPPVTLISRSESHSSRAPTDHENAMGSMPAAPAISSSEAERSSNKPEESPAYIARSAHPDGNVIVTADYMGHIKVFRQDCAYQKRLRNDANFSRKMLSRTNSVGTRHSNRSTRESLISSSQHPSSDRILSWRQSITDNHNASLDSVRAPANRSVSPRKSARSHASPGFPHSHSSPNHTSIPTITSSPSPSLRRSSGETNDKSSNPASGLDPSEELAQKSYAHLAPETNPLMLQGEQSYMFWNKSAYRAQAATANQNHAAFHSNHMSNNKSLHQRSATASVDGATTASSRDSADGGSGELLGVPVQRALSTVSALSSEEDEGEGGGEGGEMRCRRCKGQSFRARDRGKVLITTNQQYDHPAYILTTFLPPSLRPAHLAIRALNLELARIPDTSSTPAVLSMRYQFWRTTITSTFALSPVKQPVAVLLSSVLQRDPKPALTPARFLRLISTREKHATNTPYPTLDSLEQYAENTYSTLSYLLLSALPLHSMTADHIASHIGKAAGIVAILRGVPLLAFPSPPNHHSNDPQSLRGGQQQQRRQQGAVTLPLDVMAECGVREEDVLRHGAAASGLKDAVFRVATRASDHLITARQMLKNVQEGADVGHAFEHEGEREDADHDDADGDATMSKSERQKMEVERAFGVFMPAVPTGLWLRRLEKRDFDVFAEELRRRDWRLPWKAWLAYRRRMF